MIIRYFGQSLKTKKTIVIFNACLSPEPFYLRCQKNQHITKFWGSIFLFFPVKNVLFCVCMSF